MRNPRFEPRLLRAVGSVKCSRLWGQPAGGAGRDRLHFPTRTTALWFLDIMSGMQHMRPGVSISVPSVESVKSVVPSGPHSGCPRTTRFHTSFVLFILNCFQIKSYP